MLEKNLTDAIIRRALKPHAPDVWYYKTSPGWGSRVGVADIIGVAWGQAFKIEVKRKGEVPRKKQELELLRFRRAGGVAVAVQSVDEAKTFIEGIRNDRA